MLESDALGWMLDVADSTEFVSEYLGKGWFHAHNEQRGRFAELLSLRQMDELLGTFGLRHPGIKLVRADEDVPASE